MSPVPHPTSYLETEKIFVWSGISNVCAFKKAEHKLKNAENFKELDYFKEAKLVDNLIVFETFEKTSSLGTTIAFQTLKIV